MNVLVTHNEVLTKLMRRKLHSEQLNVYSRLDLVPDPVLERADSVIYDESSASFSALVSSGPLGDIAEKLVILTEKRLELVKFISQARVFTFPINLDEVCYRMERAYA